MDGAADRLGGTGRVRPAHAFGDLLVGDGIDRTVLVNAVIWGTVWAVHSWIAERDGYEPHVRGIFDDEGRLMVVINWNTDLGDAWEWADDPGYPLRYSTYAYELGINFVIYAMTH